MTAPDRDDASRELRRSEAALRSLVRAAPVGIGVVLDRTLIDVNERLCATTGYARDELVGRSARVLYPTDEEFEYVGREKYAQMRERGTGTVETRWRRKDGRILDVLLSSSPLDPNDPSSGVTFTALDISERKRAEAALRESEERYRAIVEDMPLLICRFRPGGEITFANHAYCRWFGRSREELVGLNFLSRVPEAEREGVLARIAALTVESPTQTHEHRAVSPDGGLRWQRWTNRALFDESGRAVAYQAIGEDSTERHLAQEALGQSEERYRELTDMLPEGVFETDLELRILYANQRALEMFGYSGDDLKRGVHSFDMLAPDEVPRARRNFARRMETADFRAVEYRGRKKDGTEFPIFLHLGPIVRDGTAAGFRGVIVDLSDRRRAERERSDLEEQLRQSQKLESVGRLAGGIAHDFNNLLTVIGGYGDLLVARLDDADPLHGKAKEIARAAKRASDLTRQLLAFSRRQVLEPELLDLNPVIRDMERMLRRLIGEDVALKTALAGDLWTVSADPGQLGQVVMNLAVNARDAMPSGGTMTIETGNVTLSPEYASGHAGARAGRHVVLTVSDTGHGMTREVLAQVFEPFYTTKERGKGTGLGLSTVYGIVKQSGGCIYGYSEVGIGTTFRIYLPAVDSYAGPLDGADEDAEAPGGDEVILLVEDEEGVREFAVGVLNEAGYEVLTAADGEEGLAVAESHATGISLLVTDVVMPRLGGAELAATLADSGRVRRVLYMTGYTEKTAIEGQPLQPGARILSKPFSRGALLRKVRDILDSE
jgi:PAS domain S-box-containing protein